MNIDATIRLRRDTYANWVTENPILLNGEVAVDTTNRNIKIGDGVSTWTSLDYYINDGLQDDLEFVLDIINGEDVSNPLTFLNETKNLIKAAINNKDVEVLDTDSFRSYATKIDSIETTSIDPTIEQRIESVNGENSGDVYADLTLLESNKSSIKSAIEAKGVTVGSVKLSDYDTLIADIDVVGSAVEQRLELVNGKNSGDIYADLALLENNKADIKTAIEAKGVTVGSAELSDYDTLIGNISSWSYGFDDVYEIALSSLGITSSQTVYKFISESGNVYISANIANFGLYKLDKSTKTFTKIYTGNYVTSFVNRGTYIVYAILSTGGMLKIVENANGTVTITNPVTTTISSIKLFSLICILIPVSGNLIIENRDGTFGSTEYNCAYNIWLQDKYGYVYGWSTSTSYPGILRFSDHLWYMVFYSIPGQASFSMYRCANATYFANSNGCIVWANADWILGYTINAGYNTYFPVTPTSTSYLNDITSGTKLYSGGMGYYGFVVADINGATLYATPGGQANAYMSSTNFIGELSNGKSYLKYNANIFEIDTSRNLTAIASGATAVTGGYITNNQVVFYYLNTGTSANLFYYLDGQIVVTANSVMVYNGLAIKKTLSDGTDIFYSSSGTTMYIWSSNQMVSVGGSATTINITTVNGSDYLLGGMGYLYKWNTTTKTFDLQKDTSNNSLYISSIVANGTDLYGIASSMTPGVYRLLSGETAWTKLTYSGSMLYVSGTLTLVSSGGKIFLVGLVADSTDVSSQAITKTFKIDGTTVTNVSGFCGKLLKTNRFIYYGLIGSAEYIYSLNGTYSGTGYPTRNNGYFVYVANSNTHILCG